MTGSFRGFLEIPVADRRDVFRAAAARLGTLPSHVEKDFWVCLALDVLFGGLPAGHPRVFFKGGTSLSKAFGLIQRLSEDIDLVVDRRDLGFHGARDPLAAPDLSRKQQSSLLRQLRAACAEYVGGELRAAVANRVGQLAPECSVWVDENDADRQTLLIGYRTLFPGGPTAYVSPAVKIEAGARSATDPRVTRPVVPFIAGELGEAAPRTSGVHVVSAERTFWEKLLILHGRCCGFRDQGRVPQDKDRPARHDYDAAMLIASDTGRSALARTDLLDSVRTHSLTAFRQAWKRFEEAIPGSLKLVPEGNLRTAIERDYERMSSMIFGDVPTFAWMVHQLQSAEERVNASR